MIEILCVKCRENKINVAGKQEHWQPLCLSEKAYRIQDERIVTEFNVGYQKRGPFLTPPKSLEPDSVLK